MFVRAVTTTVCRSVTRAVADVAADTTPDAFTFTSQTDVAKSAVCTSNEVVLAGFTGACNISISGASGEYRVKPSGGSYGAYTSVSGTASVNSGDTVQVRQTSSPTAGVLTTTTLTVGSTSGTFDCTVIYVAYAPVSVKFGESNTRDALELALTGGNALSDTYYVRGIVKGTMRETHATQTGAFNQILFSIAGGQWTLRRTALAGANINKFASRCFGATFTNGSVVSNGTSYIAIINANTGVGNAITEVYLSGASSPSFTIENVSGGAALALSTVQRLAIGGTHSSDASYVDTNMYRGNMSEVRLWLSSACAPINLRYTDEDVTTTFFATSGGGTVFDFSISGIAPPLVGQLVSFGASTATVVSFNSVTSRLVTSAWSGATPSVVNVDVLFWTVAGNTADLTAALSAADPGATGAIAGVAPHIYFGRGQHAATGPDWGTETADTDKGWNDGYNMGTLTGFTTTDVTE